MPSSPGPISRPSRRTSGDSRGGCSNGASPARRAATATQASCSDARDQDTPGQGMRRAVTWARVASRVAISTRLSSTGANAAAAKRWPAWSDAGEQRGERDQQQIGKGDPAELDRELVLLRARRETRRQAPHQPGHQQLAQDHHAGQHQRQDGQRLAREPAAAVTAPSAARSRA